MDFLRFFRRLKKGKVENMGEQPLEHAIVKVMEPRDVEIAVEHAVEEIVEEIVERVEQEAMMERVGLSVDDVVDFVSSRLARVCEHSVYSDVRQKYIIKLSGFSKFQAARVWKNLGAMLRAIKRFGFEPFTFLQGYKYIVRLNDSIPGLVNWYTVHRLVIVALLVADKVCDDDPWGTTGFSDIVDIRPKSLAQLEAVFLRALNYDVWPVWPV